MDNNERYVSQNITPTYHPTRSDTNPVRTMSLSTYDRPFDPTFSATRNEFRRYSSNQHYSTSYVNQDYQDQQLASYHGHASDAMQGIQSPYTTYLNDGGRHNSILQPLDQSNFPSYPPGSMLPPMQQTNIFDSTQGFPTRQANELGTLTTQYLLPPYVSSNDQNVVRTGTPVAPYNPTNIQSYGPVSRYHSEVTPPIVSVEDRPENTDQDPARQDQTQNVQPGQDEETVDQELGEHALQTGFQNYERRLRATFDSIIAGRLNEASIQLLAITHWLSTAIVKLGFQHDDATEYEHRLLTWRDFNHCWEALAQKQKTVLESELQTGQSVTDKLNADSLVQMVDELISMCDQIEGFGLVDYEMGVWEDRIISAFTACLDLIEQEHST